MIHRNRIGNPAPNAPKWFAAVETIQLAADKDWLHQAAKKISKFWRNKRTPSDDYGMEPIR
jgi:hypothetical protein